METCGVRDLELLTKPMKLQEKYKKIISEKIVGGNSLALPVQGPLVRSLVWELRSHMPHGAARGKKKSRKNKEKYPWSKVTQ